MDLRRKCKSDAKHIVSTEYSPSLQKKKSTSLFSTLPESQRLDTHLCHLSHHKHCIPEDQQWEIWDRRFQEHDS